MLNRLSEVMFVDVVRQHLESLPSDRADWLSALRDPFIGRALSALHQQPANPWTLDSLAREVGLSRTVLANGLRSLSASHRCSTWRTGACSWRRITCVRERTAWRRWPSAWDAVRGGVQPRVQEAGRCVAKPLAQAPNVSAYGLIRNPIQNVRGAPGASNVV